MRNQFLLQKSGILIAQRVIFEAAVGGGPAVGRQGIAGVSGVHKDSHGGRHFTAMDQVVEYRWHSKLPAQIGIGVPILKHHQAGWLSSVVCRRNIHAVFPDRVRKQLTAKQAGRDFSRRNTRLRQ